ncbi:MAG: hypothetical protein M3Z37_11045 [Candidatus Eremiobacteraeota bacterium]|nr:hypothetical protein [Candidatus Eremiobacteraeota bacterium]
MLALLARWLLLTPVWILSGCCGATCIARASRQPEQMESTAQVAQISCPQSGHSVSVGTLG